MEFALIPVARLHPHEKVDEEEVRRLAERIRASGRVDDPIWVARRHLVILNGHHRFEALRRLGAVRVPAWLVDYESDEVTLDRWSPGPPLHKQSVVERGSRGELFPPKTTRHALATPPPHRPTPLSELLD